MPKTLSRLHATRIDLSEEVRVAMVDQLNQQLANLSDLFTQTKFAHWNVKGKNFWSLHKLFDELAEQVEEAADEVAERLTALGGVAKGTARMAAENSKLEEFPSDDFNSDHVLDVIIDRYAAAGQSVREGINAAEEHDDKGTADLLTDVVRMLDKSLYFLESHLQKG